MDDECSSSLDRKAQNAISDFLKVVAVRESHRVAPKGQKAMQLALTTTCLICVNLEAKNLKIIPQSYENDMRNRVHVFKCEVQPMPMPTTTETEKFAFRDCVRQELPFFLHFIDQGVESTGSEARSVQSLPLRSVPASRRHRKSHGKQRIGGVPLESS